jgi:hypothetical protein
VDWPAFVGALAGLVVAVGGLLVARARAQRIARIERAERSELRCSSLHRDHDAEILRLWDAMHEVKERVGKLETTDQIVTHDVRELRRKSRPDE